MIGAMPAVAVRHERRKQEKRSKKPSSLYAAAYNFKQTSPSSRGSSPMPSPLQSPQPTRLEEDQEFYVFGKVSVLHIVVVSLLLGAILLIVGLVQFTPGANTKNHRYYLMGIGAFLMFLGWILAFVRCFFIPWHMQRRRRQLHLLHRLRKEESRTSDITQNHAIDEEKDEDSKTVNKDELTEIKIDDDKDTTEDTLSKPPSVGMSQSEDALASMTTLPPSEIDTLIKKSKSENIDHTINSLS